MWHMFDVGCHGQWLWLCGSAEWHPHRLIASSTLRQTCDIVTVFVLDLILEIATTLPFHVPRNTCIASCHCGRGGPPGNRCATVPLCESAATESRLLVFMFMRISGYSAAKGAPCKLLLDFQAGTASWPESVTGFKAAGPERCAARVGLMATAHRHDRPSYEQLIMGG